MWETGVQEYAPARTSHLAMRGQSCLPQDPVFTDCGQWQNMQPLAPWGPGRRARALGPPELQVLHEVLHGHLVQKHKVRFTALGVFLVLHPAAGSAQCRSPIDR